ncbi:MAG: tRNA 2-thiouridine(34) synthase MnmA [Candidatus Paceibacterota bacterium]
MNNVQKKVFVGLSGGVDSSVAALRLIKSGYDVVGVFIKVWQPEFLECNWEAERLDAMRVAAHLNIPFLTCDAAETYKKEVGDYFVSEYKAGRTPNPDVMCNKSVKFGAFLDFALARGADYIATGHYVYKEDVDVASFRLMRGIDVTKDQSYFLWTLSQKQLSHALFPIGVSNKDTIRREAKKASIPTAAKKDSQGICFLGHIDIPSFMRHFVTLEEGQVLNESGEIIGTHQGALVYTIGQRHGFTIHTKEERRTPLYVAAKDITKNTLVVTDHIPVLASKSCITLEKVNWIHKKPEVGEKYNAQFRYRQKPFPITIAKSADNKCNVILNDTVEQPAISQSCVLYAGDECIGGGIIATGT